MIRSSKRTQKRRRKILELDDLARERCFERDNHECVRCHVPGRTVQWAHIISRRHLCTRWELDNSLSLCAGCHLFWHEYPSLSGPWFVKNWPERNEHIQKLYAAGGKVELQAVYDQLCGVPAALESTAEASDEVLATEVSSRAVGEA